MGPELYLNDSLSLRCLALRDLNSCISPFLESSPPSWVFWKLQLLSSGISLPAGSHSSCSEYTAHG